MSRIFETDDGFFYDDNGYLITLNQTSYFGFEHRHPEYRQEDLVAVNDDRDGLKFSHWRFDQHPDAFSQMMALAKQIGTYCLRDTPLEDVGNSFDNLHQFGDTDFEHLLELPNEQS